MEEEAITKLLSCFVVFAILMSAFSVAVIATDSANSTASNVTDKANSSVDSVALYNNISCNPDLPVINDTDIDATKTVSSMSSCSYVWIKITDKYCYGYKVYVDGVYQFTEGQGGTPDGYCCFKVTPGYHTFKLTLNGKEVSKGWNCQCGVVYNWVSMNDMYPHWCERSVPTPPPDHCDNPPTVSFDKSKYYEGDTVHATVSTIHSSVHYEIKDCDGMIRESGYVSNGDKISYTIPSGVSECCYWEICFYWREYPDSGSINAQDIIIPECSRCYTFNVCPKTTCEVYVIIDDDTCVGYDVYVDGVYQFTEGQSGTPDGYCAFYVTAGTHKFELRKDGCSVSKSWYCQCGTTYRWVSMNDMDPHWCDCHQPKKEVKFRGKVTGIEEELIGAGHWYVSVDEWISGTLPCDEIDVVIVIAPPFGSCDENINEGDRVEVYGVVDPWGGGECIVGLNGESYYIKKIETCGKILDYVINKGTYPPGQIVRATMLYKSLLSTTADFKGVFKVRSPTGEIYSNSKKERTPAGREDSFGYYGDGDVLDIRIPKDASPGWYDAKLELRNFYTDELCDETEWMENQFKIEEFQEIKFVGTAIEYQSLIGASHWTVDVDKVISGPQPCSDQLKVITWDSRNPAEAVWGYVDPTISEGDEVEVFGRYEVYDENQCRVILEGSDRYYINKAATKGSIKIINVSPPPGTTLNAGDTVTFTVTVDYDLEQSDYGKIRLSINQYTTGTTDKEYSIGTLDPHSGSYTFTHTETIGDDWENVYVSVSLYAAKQGEPLPAEYTDFDYKQYPVGGGDCFETVPSDHWQGEYYNNMNLQGSPSMVRDDGTGYLSFDWDEGSPSTACGINSDFFSVRWTRTLNFDSGTWHFTATTDDGMRVYVDGSLVIDKWFNQVATTYTADVDLTAGTHTIIVEYYEYDQTAVAKLSWERGSGPGDLELILFDPEVDGLHVKINGVVYNAIKPLHWDWGDGTHEESWFAGEHTYSAGGSYTVTVTAYGEGNTELTKTVIVKVSPPSSGCGEILDYTISDGTYPPGQIVRATMLYKSFLSTTADFKGVFKVRSPTGEIYSNSKKERTPAGREDSFGYYGDGDVLDIRIPKDASTGWYDAKLELRNFYTDELCDETEWMENQFKIGDTPGTCINFDELSQGDITGQTLHYDQVDFVAEGEPPYGHVSVISFAHSSPNGIGLFAGGSVTANFKTPVSWVNLWLGNWAGGTKITLYASDGAILEEVSPPIGDYTYYEFSYAKKIATVYIFSYEGAFDDFCFETAGGGDCIETVPSDHWKGEYYNNMNLQGSPSMVRDDGTGSLSFDWDEGSPSTACGINSDFFSVRWTRSVYFDSGTWHFTATTDDGMRVYVDGSLVIDKWFNQVATTYTADVNLTAGTHMIKVEYYEYDQAAVAKLSWERGTRCGKITNWKTDCTSVQLGGKFGAEMEFDNLMAGGYRFKGIIKVRSPTNEEYSGESQPRFVPSSPNNHGKFAGGNTLYVRIPEGAATGKYDVKLELWNVDTNTLCDDTGWKENIFTVKDGGSGPGDLELILFDPEVDGLHVKINGVVYNAIKPLHWDWGDGTQEDSWFAGEHTYSSEGSYTVTVTAYGEGGAVISEKKQVEVKRGSQT